MLFNLLLASITILLCFFFLFLVVFNRFFTNPVVTKNARLQLALIIPTGVSITFAIDAIEILPVATDKTINDLSKYSKARRVAERLATCARKPKVPGSSPAASYVQR